MIEYKDSGITFENRNFDGVIWYQPRALSESLNDSVTPSDSLIKGIFSVYADSITASDEIMKLFSKPLSDSVSITDEIIKSFGVNLSDSVSSSDEIIKHSAIPLNDAYTASDLLVTKHTDKLLTDTVTVPDVLTKDLSKLLSDSVIAEDTKNVIFKDRDDVFFESREGVIWTETKRDLVVKHVEKPLAESVTPIDLITNKHFDQFHMDDVTITDNVYNHPGLFFWDDYEYFDLITVMKLDGSIPYTKPENSVFSEMRIKSIYGREPSNFYEVDEQGEEE